MEKNVTIEQMFMKLENYVQNCLLFTLYCEILPLQVKTGANEKIGICKIFFLNTHERHANQRCGENLAIKE